MAPCRARLARMPLSIAALAAAAAATALAAGALVPTPPGPKQGLSGLESCGDARALDLDQSWHYNWGVWPSSVDAGGGQRPAGSRICDPPIAREFVPMVWGCWGNCTNWAWPSIREDWASLGVTHLLGFNEPDNPTQSNLSPAQAAAYWPQVDAFAASFDPPLTLVGPGMTNWDAATGGSPWLDQFLGNLSAECRGRIAFLAQHDYSGNPARIVARAEAALAHYGRRVWLTEYSVGNAADRPTNDAFMNASLPLLQASDAVARFAWYSARNAEGSGWVNASSLLPPRPPSPAGWLRTPNTACANMTWLSQHGSLEECEARTLDDDTACAAPKTVLYQDSDERNCYCSALPDCVRKPTNWLDRYVHHGTEPHWTETPDTTCVGQGQLLELPLPQGAAATAAGCQAAAVANSSCFASLTATKVVVFATANGSVAAAAAAEEAATSTLRKSASAAAAPRCLCQQTVACTRAAAANHSLFVQPVSPKPGMAPTSTGALYMAKARRP